MRRKQVSLPGLCTGCQEIHNRITMIIFLDIVLGIEDGEIERNLDVDEKL